MATLILARDTVKKGQGPILDELAVPIEAGAIIYAGGIVVASAAGRATSAALYPNGKPIGRAEITFNNTAGVLDTLTGRVATGAAGCIMFPIRRGVFPYDNGSAGDAFTQADLLSPFYVVDDTTVGKTNGGSGRLVGGIFLGFHDDGVSCLVQFA